MEEKIHLGLIYTENLQRVTSGKEFQEVGGGYMVSLWECFCYFFLIEKKKLALGAGRWHSGQSP